jgi:hypothetical protein
MEIETVCRGRVLYIKKREVYIIRDSKILVKDTEDAGWSVVAYLPTSFFGRWEFYQRLRRLGVHDMVILSDNRKICIMKGKICSIMPENGEIEPRFSIPRGSRPLFLCKTDDDEVFWGEYFGNSDQDEVRIFGSFNAGDSFSPLFIFPRKRIRHVHGIFWDPFSKAIWVTTGDTDRESHIWVTNDRFSNLEKVVGGSQQYRAVQLLFTENWIYFGSDSPDEINHIYRLGRETGKIQKLQVVGNPVFYGCKVGDLLFFSTVVEPSSLQRDRNACIWFSSNGEEWKLLYGHRKDLFPMRLFQYGQIFFPSGPNESGYLWYTPYATKESNSVQRISIAEIRNGIRGSFI